MGSLTNGGDELIHHQNNGLHFYTFELFDRYGVPHAVFTRKGGVSPAPWDTLNLGGTVGDDADRVKENRERAFAVIGSTIEKSFDVWQVHSNEVIVVDTPKLPDAAHLKADAILTDKPGVTLFMRFADCVPILLFDKNKGVIGIVHAGWKGTIDRIVEAAIHKMKSVFASNPGDILAGIGPSIGGHHYLVGNEVLEEAKLKTPEIVNTAFEVINGKIYFDLWKANSRLLNINGVELIEIAGICTACRLDEWFSHRAENGKTGRFGVFVHL